MNSQRSRIIEVLRFAGYATVGEISPVASYTPAGWYSDHPVFEQLASALKPNLVLDVGSLWGASCVRMARLAAAASSADAVTVIAIDTWLGSKENFVGMPLESLDDYRYGVMYQKFCNNMVRAGVANQVVPFPQTSQTAAEILKHYQFHPDLIYLDAAHEYRGVLADLEAYWELLRVGGVLFGDDFEEPWYGVIRAVLEFTEKHKITLQLSKSLASRPDGGKRVNCKYVLQKHA